MGALPAPQQCYFSDIEARHIAGNDLLIEYAIIVSKKKRYQIRLAPDFIDESETLRNNKHIFKGLILNGQWPLLDGEILCRDEDLQKVLSQSVYPRNAKEKMDHLLSILLRAQKFDGEILSVNAIFNKLEIEQNYLKSGEELRFYLKTLEEKDLIKRLRISSDGFDVSITLDGLLYADELLNSGVQSNRCFIAMSFDPDVLPIRTALKQSCIECGYLPVLMDEVYIGSDETINDAMIAEMRRAKFAIADFTKQKDGVYFEAGFILGLERRVIYTCRKDWWDKTHFDTNHFPHIIYEDETVLIRKLVDRINAWLPS